MSRTSPSIRYLVATSAGFLVTQHLHNNMGMTEETTTSVLEATEYRSLGAATRAVQRWKEKNWQLTHLELAVRILIPSDVHVK